MISQRKMEANRRNALRSTGPRTPEGKAASRMNALRHGARSRRMPEPTSDPDAFARHRREVLERLAPCGEEERGLAEEAILQGWRLQRIHEMEDGLYRRDQDEAAELLLRSGELPPPGRARQAAFSAALGEVMGRSMSGPCNPYQTLARQEARALRIHTRCMADLRRLKAAREAARVQKSEQTNPPSTPGRTAARRLPTTLQTRTCALQIPAANGDRRATNEPTSEGAALRGRPGCVGGPADLYAGSLAVQTAPAAATP